MKANTAPYDALIIGSNGGIGRSLAQQLAGHQQIAHLHLTTRHSTTTPPKLNSPNSTVLHNYALDICDAHSIDSFINDLKANANELRLVINTAGVLHGPDFSPERRLTDIQSTNMQHVMMNNCIGHALILSALTPLLPRNGRVCITSLSARVGSISDNRLGGWYSYRASKAALNQIIRTASIELKRYNQDTICFGLHPGTVATQLSAPFQKNIPEQHLFTTDHAAKNLLAVLFSRTPQDSGKLFAWDGEEIPF